MDFLLAAVIDCQSAKEIIAKISPSAEHRTELIQVVQVNTEKGCFEDAND
tara:strand:+ start:388 stop:537 length:150 start_codon:yes stop_codon:yes gene_type:complete